MNEVKPNFSRAIYESVRIKKRGKQVAVPIPEFGANGHPDSMDIVRKNMPEVNIIAAQGLNLNAIRSALLQKSSVVCLVQHPFRPGTDNNTQFVVVKKFSDRRNEVTYEEYATGKIHKVQLVQFLMGWFGNVNGTHLQKYGIFLKRRDNAEAQKKKNKKKVSV